MRRSAAVAATAAALVVAGALPASAQGGTWPVPHCGQAGSDGSVTFAWADGARLAPTTGTMRPYMSTDAVATLATPGELLAVDFAGRLTASRDAGCTWTEIGRAEGSGPFAITAAPDGSAYVWSRQYDVRLYRVAGGTVTELPNLPAVEFGSFAAMAVDPADPRHLRAVTTAGNVLDSRDGGTSFTRQGTTPAPVLSDQLGVYDGAVSATNLDHILLGTVTDGVYTTMDGGATWTRAHAVPDGHRANAFTVVVSPVDDNVVWAMVLDITEHDSGATNEGRHILRSTDGGRTFRSAVDHEPGRVTITNGLLLVPHPSDSGVVYFEFGTWYAGHGSYLFRYDAARGALTATHNSYDDVTAIAFHPAVPSLMYLGLAEQR